MLFATSQMHNPHSLLSWSKGDEFKNHGFYRSQDIYPNDYFALNKWALWLNLGELDHRRINSYTPAKVFTTRDFLEAQ